MKLTKKHLPHIVVLVMVVAISAVWSVFLLIPKQAKVKEVPDPGYVPGVPQNVSASPVSQNEITITWSAPAVDEFSAAPSSYSIYRSLSGNDFAVLSPIGTVPVNPADSNQFNDTGLNSGTKYYYKVAAKNVSGEGVNSSMASATTLLPAISPPVVSAQAISSEDILLTWTEDSSVDGFDIYRKKSTDADFQPINIGVVYDFTDKNLLPSTSYTYYIVARMGQTKSSSSNVVTITTLAATAPPVVADTTSPKISNIQVVPDVETARITWQTDELADSAVVYGENPLYGKIQSDGNRVQNHTLILGQLVPEKTYHFKISSQDQAGNKSETQNNTFTTLKKPSILKNVSQVFLTTTTQVIQIVWKNPTIVESPDFAGVEIVRKAGGAPSNPNDGTKVYTGKDEMLVDKTALLNTQYTYAIFSFSALGEKSSGVSVSGGLVSASKPVVETCDRQNIDCTKVVCKKLAMCQRTPSTRLPVLTPTTTVSMLTLFDFAFLVKNEQLSLTPVEGVVHSLSGEPLKIVFSKNKLPLRVQRIVLRLGDGTEKEFIYDARRNIFYTNTIVSKKQGVYEAQFLVQYEKNNKETIPFFLSSLLPGVVRDEETKESLQDVNMRLFDKNGRLVEVEQYGESNPKQVVENGGYAWMMPNGVYYIEASRKGYETTTTSLVVVQNNVINIPIDLSTNKKKPAIIGYVGVVDEQGNIQTIVKKVVAPTVAGLSVATLLTQVSLFDVLALLRLLFLQPILLIAARKRETWGQVYNALNKLPVDLAVVRLINKDKNQVVQSMVTGKSGKYYFKIGPGNYTLEVVKDKMIFPSELLKGYASDGRKTDLYHGELLHIKDQYPIVNANIPGDPVVEVKTPGRMRLEKIARFLQFVVSISGMLVTGYSLYLSPQTWYLWALMVLHALVFVVFYRLAIPPKPKGWGVVYDIRSRRPVHQAIVRLFNTQFNKLVATQIADHHGRYFFLAGDSEYQLSFEKPEYEPAKSAAINLSGKEEENIAVNIGMKRKS